MAATAEDGGRRRGEQALPTPPRGRPAGSGRPRGDSVGPSADRFQRPVLTFSRPAAGTRAAMAAGGSGGGGKGDCGLGRGKGGSPKASTQVALRPPRDRVRETLAAAAWPGKGKGRAAGEPGRPRGSGAGRPAAKGTTDPPASPGSGGRGGTGVEATAAAGNSRKAEVTTRGKKDKKRAQKRRKRARDSGQDRGRPAGSSPESGGSGGREKSRRQGGASSTSPAEDPDI